MPWASVLSPDGEPYLDLVVQEEHCSRDINRAILNGVEKGTVRLPMISDGDEDWRATNSALLKAALFIDKLFVMSLDAFQKLRAAVVVASQA